MSVRRIDRQDKAAGIEVVERSRLVVRATQCATRLDFERVKVRYALRRGRRAYLASCANVDQVLVGKVPFISNALSRACERLTV